MGRLHIALSSNLEAGLIKSIRVRDPSLECPQAVSSKFMLPSNVSAKPRRRRNPLEHVPNQIKLFWLQLGIHLSPLSDQTLLIVVATCS